MRKLPALIAAAGLIAVALTACSSNPAAADCTGGAPSGDASKLVTATGEFGSAPTVDFPTPLKASGTQSSVITAGTGAGIVAGQKVTIEMSVYNGTDGELIEKTKYGADDTTPLSLVVAKDQVQEGLRKGLLCATEDSRIAVVVPPKDAFGEAGNTSINIGPKDNLVFVIDVDKTYLTRANGAEQTPQNGFPSVVLAENGAPGITIGSDAPPKDLKVAVLKKGTGDAIAQGDSVTVHYTGVIWDGTKPSTVFDSSWERGAPATFTAASGVDGGVIEGFADALVGQTVGSQFIAVIPPDKGYGDTAQDTIPANSTLVFVVDVLGIG
ncbi:FKBP-type peptidyl-prolyl cis-trans isomerase [Leifsonia sp. YIM 134122]|uniref:peptidylprolyl isomerase n=1 Tax=Leifsonia stereocauli TaxID=3134136 RepID=A0ABU9W1I4_9MICO